MSVFLALLLWAISPVQLLSHVQLFATPWTAACQASPILFFCSTILKHVELLKCLTLFFPQPLFPTQGIQLSYHFTTLL